MRQPRYHPVGWGQVLPAGVAVVLERCVCLCVCELESGTSRLITRAVPLEEDQWMVAPFTAVGQGREQAFGGGWRRLAGHDEESCFGLVSE